MLGSHSERESLEDDFLFLDVDGDGEKEQSECHGESAKEHHDNFNQLEVVAEDHDTAFQPETDVEELASESVQEMEEVLDTLKEAMCKWESAKAKFANAKTELASDSILIESAKVLETELQTDLQKYFQRTFRKWLRDPIQ